MLLTSVLGQDSICGSPLFPYLYIHGKLSNFAHHSRVEITYSKFPKDGVNDIMSITENLDYSSNV